MYIHEKRIILWCRVYYTKSVCSELYILFLIKLESSEKALD